MNIKLSVDSTAHLATLIVGFVNIKLFVDTVHLATLIVGFMNIKFFVDTVHLATLIVGLVNIKLFVRTENSAAKDDNGTRLPFFLSWLLNYISEEENARTSDSPSI